MFWGAPLVARELESGTYRLAWTQSVTRRRWLTIKVALVGVAALAVAGLASWLVSWWFAPLDAINMNRFDPSVFGARGIVAIGYAGFAFALGVAAGALTRRTLPAMAATLVGFIGRGSPSRSGSARTCSQPRQLLVPVTFGNGVGFVSSAHGVSIAPNSIHDPERLDHLHRACRSCPPRRQRRTTARFARPRLPGDRGGPPDRPQAPAAPKAQQARRAVPSSPANRGSRITCSSSSPTSRQAITGHCRHSRPGSSWPPRSR